MKIALVVTDAASQVERKISASFPDFIAFEGHFNRSVAKFDVEVTLTDLAWLAWHAESRLKKTGLDFDSWVNECDGVGIGEAAENVIVPLEKSQPTG